MAAKTHLKEYTAVFHAHLCEYSSFKFFLRVAFFFSNLNQVNPIFWDLTGPHKGKHFIKPPTC